MGAPITSLAMSMDSVFAAAGSYIGRYVRGKEIERFVLAGPKSADSDSDSSSSSSSESSSVDSDSDSDSDMEDEDEASETLASLTLFGSTLIALSSTGKRMYVWDIPAYVKPASKDPLANGAESEAVPSSSTTHSITPYTTLDFPEGFTATKIVHPASYLNKVVVGSKEGELAVWNVRTG